MKLLGLNILVTSQASDNFFFATSKIWSIGLEVNKETATNYTKAFFTFLLF